MNLLVIHDMLQILINLSFETQKLYVMHILRTDFLFLRHVSVLKSVVSVPPM